MSSRAAARLAAGLAVLAAAVVAWRMWPGGEEQAVRGRLERLAREFNSSVSDGLGAVAHAAELGTFFTEDVVITLGQGSTPIVGRQTLIGMATRLQPRTATFEVAFEDVTIRRLADGEADVALTATFTRRGQTSEDQSLDAREFELSMRKVGGEWLIARAATVETIK